MTVTPDHQSYLLPPKEIRRRVAALQAALRVQDIGCAWIQYPADRLYFTGTVQDGVLLVPAQGEAVLYARKSLSRAEAEAGLTVEPFAGRKGLLKAVQSHLNGTDRVGLALDVTPAAVFVQLQTALPGVEIGDITQPLRMVKAVKSPWEVEQIRQAARQAEPLFAAVPGLIKPGMREVDLSAEAERLLRIHGHAGTIRVRMSPDPMGLLTVASGDSALYPTAFNGPVGSRGMYPVTALGAGTKVLAPGETVTLDVVTAHNGYHADQTRVFFIGDNPPKDVLDAHRFCLNVLDKLAQEIRPGRVAMDVFKTVWDWAEAQGPPPGFMGAGENQVRFFAHGIGTELDELPVIADRVNLMLEPGNVLAVEPKAFLPGVGGVGVESTIVVTKTGCENLCSTTANLVCVS